MRGRWILLLILVVIVDTAVVAWWFWRSREVRYDALVRAACERYGVDPALVKAVVWRESRFDAGARGAAGELGLMQIRELAASEWAEAERLNGFNFATLADPGTNLACGTWYLAKLLRRYQHTDDPLPYALADYNAGRTHVLRWARGSAETNSHAFLAAMGFPGTRHYVTAVAERRRQYHSKFGAQPLLTSR